MKKIFSKFKQLSGYLKAFIIGALVASCFGVYAAGTCVIAATADDVSYNGSTVQAAIDELYSMSKDYCPPGYYCHKNEIDCNGNEIHATKPDRLSGLAKIMAQNSLLDNVKSEYVNSCSGVNFNEISSDTNGKGIYEIASTKNDTYPIYYYRGAVDNNNVKFGGFCWKAIRTTDTGGVKMIYNGTPDASGNCTNTTGESTQIGTSVFNTNWTSPADVGYMYGTRYPCSSKYKTQLATAYIYGGDVTYSGGIYTLTNTMTSTGDWPADYNSLNNNHYTCFSTGTTCTSVYYIYFTNNYSVYYITLTDGKKVEDALDEMFNGSNVNANSSTAKTQIDNWYNTNLSSYTSYIEDTVYCNDRSISSISSGWNPDGGDATSDSRLYFSPYKRTDESHTPSLTCSRSLDRFTVSSSKGNGALTYPIGLITTDEVMYAGGHLTFNNTYYLYTNQDYWTGSPEYFLSSGNSHFRVTSRSNIVGWSTNSTEGLRPVISLKSTDVVESGDGTSNNPYVIQTS